MSTSLTITGQMRLAASWVDDLTRTTVTDAATVQPLLSLANGTGAGQVNGYWRDVRTVAGSATDTIDTTALPLSVFGTAGTLNLASVKLIYIRNRSTTVTLRKVIRDAEVDIPPGGVFLWSAGTAAGVIYQWFTGSDIVVLGGSASATYEIILAGVKAT